MLLRAIFILIFHFIWIASALQCRTCSQTIDLKSSEMIDTTRHECELTADVQYLSCSQLLHIRYSKEQAYVLFEASPSESLVLSNAAQIMTNTTMIWLDKFQFERIFQIVCFHTDACKTDTINDIYDKVRHFQYSELWAQLLTRLYDATITSGNLVCADNQDKPVPCPHGFCQLISSDSLSFSRSCVPNGSIPNPYGVLLRSKTISETNIESSVTYTCNKPMCNNLIMAKEVRHMLEAREILIHSMTTTTTTTTITITSTTSISTTITTKRSTGNTAKPLISIQCGLIFLMTFVSQQ